MDIDLPPNPASLEFWVRLWENSYVSDSRSLPCIIKLVNFGAPVTSVCVCVCLRVLGTPHWRKQHLPLCLRITSVSGGWWFSHGQTFVLTDSKIQCSIVVSLKMDMELTELSLWGCQDLAFKLSSQGSSRYGSLRSPQWLQKVVE